MQLSNGSVYWSEASALHLRTAMRWLVVQCSILDREVAVLSLEALCCDHEQDILSSLLVRWAWLKNYYMGHKSPPQTKCMPVVCRFWPKQSSTSMYWSRRGDRVPDSSPPPPPPWKITKYRFFATLVRIPWKTQSSWQSESKKDAYFWFCWHFWVHLLDHF